MQLRAAMAVLVLSTTLEAGQSLDVFVNEGETVPFRVIQSAKAFASRILASADVTVHWHAAMHPGWTGNNRIIVIDVQRNAPAACSRAALGYSFLHERDRVSIFYDRIEIFGESATPVILGHAMAHEIAHILQGVSRHSATGVMKERWDWHDISDMRHHRLAFAPEDIRIIRGVKDYPSQRGPAVR